MQLYEVTLDVVCKNDVGPFTSCPTLWIVADNGDMAIALAKVKARRTALHVNTDAYGKTGPVKVLTVEIVGVKRVHGIDVVQGLDDQDGDQ